MFFKIREYVCWCELLSGDIEGELLEVIEDGGGGVLFKLFVIGGCIVYLWWFVGGSSVWGVKIVV